MLKGDGKEFDVRIRLFFRVLALIVLSIDWCLYVSRFRRCLNNAYVLFSLGMDLADLLYSY